MNEIEATHGLSCPNCGGVIAIPEGQVIVICPYCSLRSFVKGERGLRRYQAPHRVERQAAAGALQKFLSGNWAIARDAAQRARLVEAFPVFLPFWTVWARVAGWVFGEKRVGSGDKKRYEPREVRIVQEMTWNGPACDVGEFGVSEVPIQDGALQAFNPDALHQAGMVFEPVGSFGDAKAAAENRFQDQVRRRAGLDRVSQLFIRLLSKRQAIVYYPLWVLRYLYRGRAFQVVVDGSTGKVLYGKAPGNTLYRAAVLVGGMALGAFLAVTVPSFLLSQVGGNDSDGLLAAAAVVFLFGLGLMAVAYRVFRYGEQYEYRSAGKGAGALDLVVQIKDVEEWINRLN